MSVYKGLSDIVLFDPRINDYCVSDNPSLIFLSLLDLGGYDIMNDNDLLDYVGKMADWCEGEIEDE